MKNNNNSAMSENVDEVYFSVDIEADGSIPGPYSMSSFGAVAFGTRLRNGELVKLDLDAGENCFYAELKPISDDFIPEAAAVAGFDRQELIANGRSPEEAMPAFDVFVQETTGKLHPAARPVFVGWPVPYDWMWIYWYLMQFNGSSPFGHSTALDTKSYFAGKSGIAFRRVGKRSLPASVKSNRKHSHNALDDAREQAETAFNILQWQKDGN